MGLLDGGYEDPRQAQMLALAAGLLGAPSLGAGLSKGLLASQQAGAHAQDAQYKRQYIQSQMDENRAQTEQRMAQIQELVRKREEQQKFDTGLTSALSGGANIPTDFKMMAPGANQQVFQSQRPQIPPELLAQAVRLGKVDELQKIMGSQDWGLPEVARVIKGGGADGSSEQEQQYDKFGRTIGDPIRQAVKYERQNLGDRVVPVNPLERFAPLTINQDPNSKASNAVAWANLGETKRHHGATEGIASAAAARDAQSVTYLPDENNVMRAFPTKLAPGVQPVGRTATDASGNAITRPAPAAPQHITTGLISNFKTAGVLDSILGKMQTPAGKNATGIIAGLTPSTILNRQNPEGALTRADIADIESMTFHDRSGANVTASESPRLRPFIPSVWDKAEDVVKKVTRMKEIIDDESKMMGAFYPKAYETAAGAAKAVSAAKAPKGFTYLGQEK